MITKYQLKKIENHQKGNKLIETDCKWLTWKIKAKLSKEHKRWRKLYEPSSVTMRGTALWHWLVYVFMAVFLRGRLNLITFFNHASFLHRSNTRYASKKNFCKPRHRNNISKQILSYQTVDLQRSGMLFAVRTTTLVTWISFVVFMCYVVILHNL